jgi:chromate transporter
MDPSRPDGCEGLKEGAVVDKPAYSLWQIVGYALKLGSLGFGGPVALVGYMHRDLVEKRGWVTEEDYKEGLALAQLMPGPLAAQLAIYLGYVHYRILGATLVGIGFVLPSFLMVLGLGWAYGHYGGLSWMQSVFYGVGASVIGIIGHSAVKLSRKTVGRDGLLWLVYGVSAVVTVVTESETVWLFLGAGLLVWLVKAPPGFLKGGSAVGCVCPTAFLLGASGALSVAGSGVLWQIALFFFKAGAFVFGSGLAIVPFLYGGVVKEFGWLNDQQFLDAVAVAMITPGPVVITVGFIGYLVAGLSGATIAALATFLPCYLLTIIPAPYFKRFGKRADVVAFVNGVTAAAVGAIAGAVVVLARRTICDESWTPDPIKVVITLGAVGVLWWFKKVPEPVVVGFAAVVGLILSW